MGRTAAETVTITLTEAGPLGFAFGEAIGNTATVIAIREGSQAAQARPRGGVGQPLPVPVGAALHTMEAGGVRYTVDEMSYADALAVLKGKARPITLSFRLPARGVQLCNAARTGDEAAVQRLLQQGTSADAKDDAGEPAICYAAAYGHDTVILLLAQARANLNARDASGGTALMEAATNGNVGCTELLLRCGADVGAASKGGWTALMSAAMSVLLPLPAPLISSPRWDSEP